MTPTTLPGYLKCWLQPMTPEDRVRVLNEVLDAFCPGCGRENPEGGQRCQCENDE